MLNLIISSKLRVIAQLTSLEGASAKFRSLAFSNASRIVGILPNPIESADLTNIKGIGPSLQQVIGELIQSEGKTCKRLKELERTHPAAVLELTEVSGIGAIKAYKLYNEHGVKSLKELGSLLKKGKIKDDKLTASVKEAITRKESGMDRLPIHWVLPLVRLVCKELLKAKGVTKAEAAGSIRRFKETVGDCDILVQVDGPKARDRAYGRFATIVEKYGGKGGIVPSLSTVRGDYKARGTIPIQGYPFQIDLLFVPKKEWGAAMAYFTGSKESNIVLRTIAKKKGILINEHGLFKGGKRIGGEKEEDLYRILKLPYVPSELREESWMNHLYDDDEAEGFPGKVPNLLTTKDLNQDLHVHSTWSDGVSSPEEMINRAIELGFRRLAITDHSYLIKKRFKEYVEDIRKLKKKYADRIEVLVGSEVDIKKDGTLGLPDEDLQLLDFVVASVHHNHKENITARFLAATKNRYVNILGHPTGRLIPDRGIPECDWDQVFAECAKRKVGLEINSNGERMDLPDFLVRKAKEYGCKFSINTDAHRVDYLGHFFYGVKIARRAGLTKRDLYYDRDHPMDFVSGWSEAIKKI